MQRMFVILAIMVLSSSPSHAAEPLPPFEKYVCEGSYFRAKVPSTWTRSDRNRSVRRHDTGRRGEV